MIKPHNFQNIPQYKNSINPNINPFEPELACSSSTNLNKLTINSIINGEIISVHANQDGTLNVKISINNSIINAKSDFPFIEGEKLTLQVAQLFPEIKLRLISPSFFNKVSDQAFISVLKNGDIHITTLLYLAEKLKIEYPFLKHLFNKLIENLLLNEDKITNSKYISRILSYKTMLSTLKKIEHIHKTLVKKIEQAQKSNPISDINRDENISKILEEISSTKEYIKHHLIANTLLREKGVSLFFIPFVLENITSIIYVKYEHQNNSSHENTEDEKHFITIQIELTKLGKIEINLSALKRTLNISITTEKEETKNYIKREVLNARS